MHQKSNVIHKVIQSLATEFQIKDFGDLHYFLGIQISHTPIGLNLSQSKYIQDLLLKTDMLATKACATPCLSLSEIVEG